MKNKLDVLIIGAGAAGVGFGIALKELGIDSYLILEKGQIGESFRQWPAETRFITPSFTSNGFGMPDLNALSPDTSPAYTLGKERLSGTEYADYLKTVVEGYELAVQENTTVLRVEKLIEGYLVTTPTEQFSATYLIFAVGEFQSPSHANIAGAKFGQHYGDVKTWKAINGETATIIGGNESAIDAAINLAQLGKVVTVYTRHSGLNEEAADPSLRLSPYTRQRLTTVIEQGGKIKIITDHELIKIEQSALAFELTFANDKVISVVEPPILCTGFSNGVLPLAGQLFALESNQHVSLTEYDESTLANNVFLIGPQVRHQDVIFCYIYKFRQRFAYIIEEIAKRESILLDQDVLENYQRNAMYLNDCSTCGVACIC